MWSCKKQRQKKKHNVFGRDCRAKAMVLRVWASVQWRVTLSAGNDWGKCEADATSSGHLGIAARGWDDERRERPTVVMDEMRTRLTPQGSHGLEWPKQTTSSGWTVWLLPYPPTPQLPTVGQLFWSSVLGALSMAVKSQGAVWLRWLLCVAVWSHPTFCFPCDNRVAYQAPWPRSHFEIFIYNGSQQWSIAINCDYCHIA